MTGKTAAVGYVGGFTESKTIASGAAGALGFVDGAIGSDSETLGGALKDGLKSAAVESSTTFGAMKFAEKLTGGKNRLLTPLLKSSFIAGAEVINERAQNRTQNDLPSGL